MNSRSQYLSAIVSDIAGAFQIPGGAVFGQAIQDLFANRMKRARDILVEEIQSGQKDVYEAAEVDEVVAIVYRYMRAAQEGTARINLRLLAQVVAGQRKSSGLKADEFLYYAGIIASLSREEIILLGNLHKYLKEELLQGADTAAYKAQERAKQEMVPLIFETAEEFMATIGAVMRTGLVIGYNAYGGMVYQTSSLMDKLCKFASFQEVLSREYK